LEQPNETLPLDVVLSGLITCVLRILLMLMRWSSGPVTLLQGIWAP